MANFFKRPLIIFFSNFRNIFIYLLYNIHPYMSLKFFKEKLKFIQIDDTIFRYKLRCKLWPWSSYTRKFSECEIVYFQGEGPIYIFYISSLNYA